MNEWNLAAEIKSWWDQEFSRFPEWNITSCRVEESVPGSGRRSDLFLQGRKGPLMCGELRLPDHPQASPWHPDNMLDAISKATIHGSRYAFTSDGTVLLLIDTTLTGPAPTRVIQKIELLQFTSRSELASASFFAEVRKVWVAALHELALTISEIRKPPGMAADEQFINSLRALLSAPVAAIRDELNAGRKTDKKFEHRLVMWMVDEQGWTHLPTNWEAEVFRAAQLTAYVFTVRLMFYEALRRSQPTLPPLEVPAEATAPIARAVFKAYFDEARDKSQDYETIFNWDGVCEYALVGDAAVAGWRRVLAHLSVFDLAHIGYDILGKMFERLIDPHERYRWGQHYTSPDVVDLMLSFALPDGKGAVLDPAVGGGTFLVRAYVRKRHFEGKTHQELLKELFGLDISGFAASLATINLAVRSLDFADNYPQIAARSFFLVDPAKTFMSLPAAKRFRLDGQLSPIAISQVQAVVSNPPYVRLHELGEERTREAQAVLNRGRLPLPRKLHGATNYHVYFWLHGAQFLADGGRLVIITSGEWMDSDYGVSLQGWLLQHFALECFIESLAEPWFSEARVGTVVTVARREADADIRAANRVRFVMLRRPLRELFGSALGEKDHLSGVDTLKERILALPLGHGEADDLDWSTVPQSELLSMGLSQ